MDPEALLRPVGPLPPRVYWLRRLALLLVLVIVILLLARACGGSGSTPPRAGGRPSSTPSASTSPVTEACGTADVTVVAGTDAASYPRGVVPKLTVTIRTKRTTGCTLALAGRLLSWSIYSGSDLVWTSLQCPPPTGASAGTSAVLSPAHPVARAVSWDRRRSVKGCSGARTDAQPGTYQLFVTVAGARSAPAVFHLTS